MPAMQLLCPAANPPPRPSTQPTNPRTMACQCRRPETLGHLWYAVQQAGVLILGLQQRLLARPALGRAAPGILQSWAGRAGERKSGRGAGN